VLVKSGVSEKLHAACIRAELGKARHGGSHSATAKAPVTGRRMTTVVHVMQAEPKKEEKKGLMDSIPAVGSHVDKTVYVVLGSLSVAIFILTAVANVASSKPVSSVSLYLRCVAVSCLPCAPHPRHAVPCRASWRSLVDRSGLSRGARACR
jgi:hypothetical protein